MAGTPAKKLFTAEIKMMQEKGQELPTHIFEASNVEVAPTPETKGVSNAQLLSAILDLQIIMRKNSQAAPAPVQAPTSETEQLEQDFEAQ